MRTIKRRVHLSDGERCDEPAPGTPVFFRALLPDCIKAIDTKQRSVSVVASTEVIDSHGEIVEQVWDLSRYEANPIVLWNHSAGGLFGSDVLPIGRAENVRVEEPGTPRARLEADLIFASEKANPQAEHIFQLFAEKVLRAVSVGFRPGAIRYEEIDGREVEILSKNQLLEISATPIGANPEALAKSMQAESSYRASLRHELPPSNRRGEEKENAMSDTNTLERDNAALEQQVRELSDKLLSSEDRIVTLSERCESLEHERVAQQERADSLYLELTQLRLDGLIGKKLFKGERDFLLKLAEKDRELFEEQLALVQKRQDSHLLHTIVKDDPQQKRSYADDNGASLHAAVTAIANS